MAWRNPFRRRREERSVGEWGSSAIPPASAGSVGSFAYADMRRAEAALQSVAMWASVDLLAKLISTLPLDVYRGVGADRQVLRKPALLQDPSGDGYGIEDWLGQYVFSRELRGNVYGNVAARDGAGYPTQVVLYHPDDVHGWRDRRTGQARWQVDGRLLREDEKVWHQRAYAMPGCLLGLSPVAHHAVTIGQNLAASRFGAQWFADGAHPSGVWKNTEAPIDETQARTIKARILSTLRGSREPHVMGKGWDYQPIGVNAEESQFLATQNFTAAECARIYGPGLPEILGYPTGGTLTYANIEQRAADLLTYTLDPRLVRLERMFTAMLPQPQYVKFNRAALHRTDLMTRFKAYQIGVASKFMLPNEAREFEDWGPLTDADKAELQTLTPAPVVTVTPPPAPPDDQTGATS